MAFEDNDLTPQEKQIVLLTNLYSVVPGDTQAALETANWFLAGGKEASDNGHGVRVYSFAKDANYIFAAFRQTHGIDLSTAKLHWWTFLALFMDLSPDTTFCQLVGLRKRIKTGKATKEEMAAAREMSDLIELDRVDERTLEEKEIESEFLRKVEALKLKRQQK